LASSPTLNSATDSAGASADSVVHLQIIIVELRMELNAVKAALHTNKGVSTDGQPEAAGHVMHTRVDKLEAALLLDRKIAATPIGVTTGAHSSQPLRPSTPQKPAMPNLALDLKASVGTLIEKVNKTLMASEASAGKLPDVSTTTSGLPLTSEPTAAALMLSAGSAGVANMGAGPPGNDLETLQAVNELRERNLALREENIELAEELLAQAKSPGGSVRGLQWTPSAQQSACATPLAGEGSTLQVTQIMAAVVLPGVPEMRGIITSGVAAGEPMTGRPHVSEARVLGVMKGPTFKATINTSNSPTVTGPLLSAPEHGLGVPRSLSRGRAPIRASNLTGGAVPVSKGMSGLCGQSRPNGIRPPEPH